MQLLVVVFLGLVASAMAFAPKSSRVVSSKLVRIARRVGLRVRLRGSASGTAARGHCAAPALRCCAPTAELSSPAPLPLSSRVFALVLTPSSHTCLSPAPEFTSLRRP